MLPPKWSSDSPNSSGTEDTVRAVVGADGDSVPGKQPPGGSPVLVTAPPLPEPGQVVEVRGSTWAVANASRPRAFP